VQKKIGDEFPDKAVAVKWEILPADVTLNIDPQLTEWAVLELFRNAFRHNRADGELHAKVSVIDGWFSFCISEPKADEMDPEQWLQPLHKVSHGHYSLGLRRVRSIIAAQGGELSTEFDQASRMLINTIRLPCSAKNA
jgi:K+-sensing histidine kinase KdpD